MVEALAASSVFLDADEHHERYCETMTRFGEMVESVERRADRLAGGNVSGYFQKLHTDGEHAAGAENAERAVSEKELELDALEGRRRGLVGRAQDVKRLAEAERNRDEAQELEAVAKIASSILRNLQAEFVDDAFRPLLERANALFPEVLKTPLVYCDGEIGTWRSGTWVNHATFSGAEKKLAYVAIQAALAARSPVRILILDELGMVDTPNLVRVFKGIHDAIERGDLHQFVGIDIGRLFSEGRELEMLTHQIDPSELDCVADVNRKL